MLQIHLELLDTARQDAFRILTEFKSFGYLAVGKEFVETQFLEQVTYFQDITIAPIEHIGPSVEAKDIQAFLIQKVSQYIQSRP